MLIFENKLEITSFFPKKNFTVFEFQLKFQNREIVMNLYNSKTDFCNH